MSLPLIACAKAAKFVPSCLRVNIELAGPGRVAAVWPCESVIDRLAARAEDVGA